MKVFLGGTKNGLGAQSAMADVSLATLAATAGVTAADHERISKTKSIRNPVIIYASGCDDRIPPQSRPADDD